MCRTLNVSKSSYYEWRGRAEKRNQAAVQE